MLSPKQNIFLTTSEAAKVSGYSRDYLIRLCRAGSVICERAGREWKIDPVSLASFARLQELRRQHLHGSLSQTMKQSYRLKVPSPATALPLLQIKEFLTTEEAARASGYTRDYV